MTKRHRSPISLAYLIRPSVAVPPWADRRPGLVAWEDSADISVADPHYLAADAVTQLSDLDQPDRLLNVIAKRDLAAGRISIQPGHTRGRTREWLLTHCQRMLGMAVPIAEQCGKALVLEGSGAVFRSDDLWRIHDAVGSPALRIALDLSKGTAPGDSISVALPRLARALEWIVVPAEPQPHLDEVHLMELLRGFHLKVVLGVPAYQPPESLNLRLQHLAALRDRPPVELTAYRGDRTAPRFKTR